MLKKNSAAALTLALLVACTVLPATTNAQPRRARRRAQTSQAVTVLDNEARLSVKNKPKGVTVTDNEARLRRTRGRARASQSMSQQPASAVVDNTIVDGPQRVKAKKPGHFIGSGDDGQSIRKKQPRGRRGRH